MTDPGPPSRRPRPRRHRRVDAPATGAGTDPSDDLPGPDVADAPAAVPGSDPADRAAGGRARGGPPPSDAARDAWIAAQRPPHWD